MPKLFQPSYDGLTLLFGSREANFNNEGRISGYALSCLQEKTKHGLLLMIVIAK